MTNNEIGLVAATSGGVSVTKFLSGCLSLRKGLYLDLTLLKIQYSVLRLS